VLLTRLTLGAQGQELSLPCQGLESRYNHNSMSDSNYPTFEDLQNVINYIKINWQGPSTLEGTAIATHALRILRHYQASVF